MTNYQAREAKRLGLDREIDRAESSEWQRKAREIRAENLRRTAAAS